VTVLVAYATKHEADVANVGEVEDVARYDAVVLGSAVYVGHWLSNARAFAREHADELADRPTRLFSSGPVGHPLRPTDDDAVQIDDIVEATRAKEHRVFPGKLNRSELNCCEWALVFALRVKEGDYRNEGEVSAWAGEIAASLERQPSSSPSSSA
jgi:menaquinone-dependent protoporphyrinogen oxidase